MRHDKKTSVTFPPPVAEFPRTRGARRVKRAIATAETGGEGDARSDAERAGKAALLLSSVLVRAWEARRPA